jgi:hypothetical protein
VTESLVAAPPALVWQNRGVGGGGALFAPAFSPHDSQELWISCDMSELFRSRTLGSDWDAIHFREIQGNRPSLVGFTATPGTLFTLDCTSIDGGDQRRPTKSIDGGKTWTILSNDPTGEDAFGLWSDPNASGRLLLSGWNTVHFSSTSGTTWSTVYTGTDSGAGVRIAGVIWSGTAIYVGTNHGVLRSTNSGSSFAIAAYTGIPSTQRIVTFAGGGAAGSRRLVCATVPESVYNGESIEEFYDALSSASAPLIYTLSPDSSSAWQSATSGLVSTHKLPLVAMTPNNPSTMWVAGDNNADVPVVYRSTNSGSTWTQTLITSTNGNVATGWAGDGGDRGWTYGGDPVGFGVSPVDANSAAFTDYGFCHVTTNGGTSWRQTYVSPADQNAAGAFTPKGKSYRSVGLEDTTCWQLLFPTNQRLILCNSDIRGSKSDDGGFSWNFNYTGHADNSMYRVVKHTSGTLFAATSSVHDLYQSTYLQDSRIDGGAGRVLASGDNGSNWTTLRNFAKPVVWVATDPTNSNRLYAAVVHSANATSGTGGIWRTDNLSSGTSATWTRCAAPPRTEYHPFNIVVLNDGTLVASYCARRTSAGAFTPSSGVFVSINSGTTWADRSHADMQYWTKDVVIDPHDNTQGTWYACVFNGWGGAPNGKGGVFRTTDRGVNWTRIMDNADVPSGLCNVESLTIDPNNPNVTWLTTEYDGLWYTPNISVASPVWEEVTSFPFRQPTRVFFDPLNPMAIWVTTFGHGLLKGMPSLAAWLDENFGVATANTAISGDDADPDWDGLRNIHEYGFNLSPLIASTRTLQLGVDNDDDPSGLPYVFSNGTATVYRYAQRRASASPGIGYFREQTSDLVSWTPALNPPTVTVINETWELVEWTLDAPATLGRIRID